ncbi:unnamed protein product, partial [Rotaria sordida]
KSFIYQRLSNDSNEWDSLIDGEDKYQSVEELSQFGIMFDYRSALFYADFHDSLVYIILLIEHEVECLVNIKTLNETHKPSSTDNYFSSFSNGNKHKIEMCEMHLRVAQDMAKFYDPLHVAKQKLVIEIKESYTKRTALHIAAGKCLTEIIYLSTKEGECKKSNDLNDHIIIYCLEVA